MRLSCTIDLLEGRLSVSWYGQSIPVDTPWDGFVAGSDDLETTSILPPLLLGTSWFPAAEILLPPLLLLDPPTRTREDHCGIAQVILSPNGELGEPLQVQISAKALKYWQTQEPLSSLHQQAHAQRQAHITRQFALPLEALPEDVQTKQAKALRHFSYAFPQAWTGDEAQEVLRALHVLRQVKAHWCPIPWLFSCLQHMCEDVGALATAILEPTIHLVPWKNLEDIAWQGPTHARLLVLRLAAKHPQREEAISLFLATRWDANPSIRIASLDGLIALDTWRFELLAALETALSDEVAGVRATALWHLLHLRDPQSATFLVVAYHREQEAWLRFGLHLCLVSLHPTLLDSVNKQPAFHTQK